MLSLRIFLASWLSAINLGGAQLYLIKTRPAFDKLKCIIRSEIHFQNSEHMNKFLSQCQISYFHFHSLDSLSRSLSRFSFTLTFSLPDLSEDLHVSSLSTPPHCHQTPVSATLQVFLLRSESRGKRKLDKTYEEDARGSVRYVQEK